MAGAVDWSLAERAAREVARVDDRAPTPEERARLEEAFRLAEHWLDAGALPQPPDAGRTLVLDRDEWIDLAIPMFMRLIGPIAEASTEALVALAGRQLGELGRLLEESPDALDGGAGGLDGLGVGGGGGGALDGGRGRDRFGGGSRARSRGARRRAGAAGRGDRGNWPSTPRRRASDAAVGDRKRRACHAGAQAGRAWHQPAHPGRIERACRGRA
jgi:hypothetical protein